jgi:hypothetical protein
MPKRKSDCYKRLKLNMYVCNDHDHTAASILGVMGELGVMVGKPYQLVPLRTFEIIMLLTRQD